jgi:hypothetical protein
MTSEEFAKGMAHLAAAFRESLSRSTLEVYFDALGHYEHGDFLGALKEVIEDLHWFPAIADLRTRILRIRRDRQSEAPRFAPFHEDLPIKDLVRDLKQKMHWT